MALFEFLSRERETVQEIPARRLKADAVMTSPAITVDPATPVEEIARLLYVKGISAVPVVDTTGAVVGIVSDGDLIGRAEEDRLARRSWWLRLIAGGREKAGEAAAKLAGRTARDIMSAPVITVTPENTVGEVAALFTAHRIKRAPVVGEGRIVGIVSRTDLVRAFLIRQGAEVPAAGPASAEPQQPQPQQPAPEPAEAPESKEEAAPPKELSATDFRGLVQNFEHMADERRDAERKAADALRAAAVRQLTGHHLGEEAWQTMLHRAREAAACGATELLILRFPHDLCSDGGRAVNAPDPEWPATLRGEAAEVYLRWERELKPKGFHLVARVIDFPGGFMGDIGLYLVWGK
jgi:CBS domain-containing protein